MKMLSSKVGGARELPTEHGCPACQGRGQAGNAGVHVTEGACCHAGGGCVEEAGRVLASEEAAPWAHSQPPCAQSVCLQSREPMGVWELCGHRGTRAALS